MHPSPYFSFPKICSSSDGGIGSVSRETLPVAEPSGSPKNVSRETNSSASPPGQAHIIAVINQKGGVGKTTSAVNLASDLASRDYRTLLIDLDPQGNAATSLGVDRFAENVKSSEELLFHPDDQREPFRIGHKQPDLIPGHVGLIRADIDLYAKGEQRDFVLRKSLEPLKSAYDFIIIDSPPSLGILTLNILIAANWVVIPIQCEYLALEGLSMLLDTLGELTKTHNPALKILGCLVTMTDLRTNLSQQVVADVRTHLGNQVFETMIPRTIRLSECPSHGKTIFQYDRWGAGARSYEALTNEVLQRLGLPKVHKKGEG